MFSKLFFVTQLKHPALRRLRLKRNAWLLGITTVIGLSNMHCTTADPTAPMPTQKDSAAVQILAPLAGATFRLSDTNYIILQIDTTRFNRPGLYLTFSADSGKCWAIDCLKGGSLSPYKIKSGKGAIRKDTVKWVPIDNFGVTAGQSLKIKIVDYPPSTITLLSDFFTITN